MNTNRNLFITAAVSACLGTACNGQIELGRNDSPVNVGGAGGEEAHSAGGAAGQFAGGAGGPADAAASAAAFDEYLQPPDGDDTCPRAVLSVDRSSQSWGYVRGWGENQGVLEFSTAGIAWRTALSATGTASWSIAGGELDPNGPSAWYYATPRAAHPDALPLLGPSTLVAHAAGYTRVSDIVDARALEYSADVVGPLGLGEIVVFQQLGSETFLAMRTQNIEDVLDASCSLWARADFVFYLQTDGSGDFSNFEDVEP